MNLSTFLFNAGAENTFADKFLLFTFYHFSAGNRVRYTM
jgi:hypothetical protein